ncbi:MAG: alpha/beta fold hydrolase [Anaerolineae bacterium]
MSAIILESSLVHYEALGRGRPLVFLHDWLGSWRYWVPTMVELSPSFRAYALDFWGFGDSDKVVAWYSVGDLAGQVALFLEQMGIGRVPIIGHGLGGVVGTLLAQQYPERVAQLMGVSVPLSPRQMGRTLSGYGGGENPARVILGRRLREYEEVALEAGKTDGAAVVESVRSAREADVLGALRALEMPVLLVSGGEDPLVAAPDASILAELDYNVYSLVLAGSGHYPMLDEGSKFCRLLRDFLAYGDAWEQYDVKDEWKRRMR